MFQESASVPALRSRSAGTDRLNAGGRRLSEAPGRGCQGTNLHQGRQRPYPWISLHHREVATKTLAVQSFLSRQYFSLRGIAVSAERHVAAIRRLGDDDPSAFSGTILWSRHVRTMAHTLSPRKSLPRPDFSDVPDTRRKNLAAVRATDTKPEMLVRQALHRLGYRYRLHDRRLPGRPDMVFPSRKAVVWIHGCFWHQHPDPTCRNAVIPKTRREWWEQKLDRNRARDEAAVAAVEAAGWRTAVVWECETRRGLPAVLTRLRAFLGPPGQPGRG